MYDFIVVGAGPAGARLATRLAKSAAKPQVLLVEAGGNDNEDPDGTMIFNRYQTAGTFPNLNWGYKSEPQANLAGRHIDYHRGKCLGGSSSLNYGCWTVGSKGDYDEWARIVQDDDYDWNHMQERIKSLERYRIPSDPTMSKYVGPKQEHHSRDGQVCVEVGPEWEPIIAVVLDGAKQSGSQLNPDINSGNPLGWGVCPSNADQGRRFTAAALLKDSPPNLTVLTNAQVTKVIMEGKTAKGIIANGQSHYASKEIVLSGGALDSPKLLMLSGIGDESELAVHGIQSCHHLPGVGKNLQDHPFTLLSWQHKDPTKDGRVAVLNDPTALEQAQGQFTKDGSGPLSMIYSSLTMGWFKDDALFDSDEFKQLPPDVQKHLKQPTVPLFEMAGGMPHVLPGVDPSQSYITGAAFTSCPQSRGSVRLKSSDPNDAPLADPALFSNPFDKLVFITALRNLMEMMESPGLAKDILHQHLGPASKSDEDIWAWAEATCGTAWHMSCTVKMGLADDDMSCVDTSFRLKGLKGLRCADMSVTPFLPSPHPVAMAYMIGETAAEKMIEEYKLDL